MKTSKQLQSEIEVLQSQLIQAIELEKNHPKINVKVAQLADMLHERMCFSNHADQCGYGYESWPPEGGSILYLSGEKKRYYYKALDLLAYIDYYVEPNINANPNLIEVNSIADILQIFFPKHGQTLRCR